MPFTPDTFFLSVGNVLFGVVLQGYPRRVEINQAIWKISLYQACCICIILVSKYFREISPDMIQTSDLEIGNATLLINLTSTEDSEGKGLLT